MTDEQTKENDTEGDKVNKPVEEDKETPLSIVEEAKKVRDEIKAENDRREKILADEQKLKANELLGGTSGGRVEPEKEKEETPQEYAKKVMRNDL